MRKLEPRREVEMIESSRVGVHPELVDGKLQEEMRDREEMTQKRVGC